MVLTRLELTYRVLPLVLTALLPPGSTATRQLLAAGKALPHIQPGRQQQEAASQQQHKQTAKPPVGDLPLQNVVADGHCAAAVVRGTLALLLRSMSSSNGEYNYRMGAVEKDSSLVSRHGVVHHNSMYNQ